MTNTGASGASRGSRAPRASRRLILLALAGVFVAFAAYGSFVPLRWRPVPLAEAIEQFRQTPFVLPMHASGSDFVTNVLLFVPIGFFLLGATAGRSRSLAALCFVPVVMLGLALSVAIEFGQIFVSGRTPSWNDVFAETLGGGLGALAWAVVGTAVVDWLAVLLHSDSQSDRVFRLLGAYTALWIILGLQPFDFTIRRRSWRKSFVRGESSCNHSGEETNSPTSSARSSWPCQWVCLACSRPCTAGRRGPPCWVLASPPLDAV
jgi:VanZ family protein